MLVERMMIGDLGMLKIGNNEKAVEKFWKIPYSKIVNKLALEPDVRRREIIAWRAKEEWCDVERQLIQEQKSEQGVEREEEQEEEIGNLIPKGVVAMDMNWKHNYGDN